MHITLTLDDELLAAAREAVGELETAALVDVALRALIERESAGRLARLGGSEPQLTNPRRNRRR